MIDLNIPKKKRSYIPQELEMKWDTLEPILNELLEREIQNVQELEQWLRDKSELEAALDISK